MAFITATALVVAGVGAGPAGAAKKSSKRAKASAADCVLIYSNSSLLGIPLKLCI